ncbi:MAG: SWIM zinc finger family protein, partial [Deinococcota bacterium]
MAQPVSLQYIRNLFGATIFERGKTYYNGGHVGKLSLAGSKLTASVRGNDVSPYKVTVTLKDTEQDKGSSSEVSRASCSCPYEREFSDYCKHIAAVLLKYHHNGADEDSSDLADSLVEALLELPAHDLRAVLANTFKYQPDIVNPLYIQLQQHTHSTANTQPNTQTKTQSQDASNTA